MASAFFFALSFAALEFVLLFVPLVYVDQHSRYYMPLWITAAVIAALNMANELIRFRNRDSNLESDVGGRLRILRERVESALEKGQQLEL